MKNMRTLQKLVGAAEEQLEKAAASNPNLFWVLDPPFSYRNPRLSSLRPPAKLYTLSRMRPLFVIGELNEKNVEEILHISWALDSSNEFDEPSERTEEAIVELLIAAQKVRQASTLRVLQEIDDRLRRERNPEAV